MLHYTSGICEKGGLHPGSDCNRYGSPYSQRLATNDHSHALHQTVLRHALALFSESF